MRRASVGWIQVFLLVLIILSLTNCTTTKLERVRVSDYLLEPCPIPTRKRYSNRGLRQYTIDLYKNLQKCNADKEAIKKELGQ